MFLKDFFENLLNYTIEILPALFIGFLISGIVFEFLPERWTNEYLRKKGFKGILYATFIGTITPVCCWGSLPIAVSLWKKGSKLGPVLSVLIATPATSINALIVTWKLLGFKFAIYLFFSVIFIGVIVGLIGNIFDIEKNIENFDQCICSHNENKKFKSRIKNVFRFAFYQLPKEIGKETIIGIVLASLINSFFPLKFFIKNYLKGPIAYIFSIIFGISVYMCATMSVPLVDAFLKQGLEKGASFTLLLIGPITSYGTILVIRKEFGFKILIFYLLSISILGFILGYLFNFI